MQTAAVSNVSVAVFWYSTNSIMNAYAFESELDTAEQTSQHSTVDSKEHKHQIHNQDSRHSTETQAQQKQIYTFMYSYFSWP